ncbi:MAG: hypothetical protein ACHQ3P_10265, partial [Candidatus Limnocylindrales bacterium]
MTMSNSALRRPRGRLPRLFVCVTAAALIASASTAVTASARSAPGGMAHARGAVGRLGEHTFADSVRRAHSAEASLHHPVSPVQRSMPAPRSPSSHRAATAPGVARSVAPLVVSTDPMTTLAFEGTAENDLGGTVEPPDEWIAVGP